MTVIISSEANAPLPSPGEATLFINTDKGGVLYAKYSDGSLQPYNGASSASSTELAQAWMSALKCALLGGLITSTQFQSLMDQGITIQSNSSTDSNGNSTSTLSVGSRIIPLNSFTVDSLAFSLTVAAPTHQIVPTFDPVYASNKGVTYVSSDPTKATVSSTGLVTRVANGVTNISAIPQADPSKTKIIVVTTTA